jgi:hypothetical protein
VAIAAQFETLEVSMRARFAMVFVILTVFVTLVSAQMTQLSGTVRDVAGHVLPGVTVTVTSPSNDLRKFTTTDKDGKFTFKGLAESDAYVVTFSLVSFRSVTQRGVKVEADTETTADAVMLFGGAYPPSTPGDPRDRRPENQKWGGIVLLSDQ